MLASSASRLRLRLKPWLLLPSLTFLLTLLLLRWPTQTVAGCRRVLIRNHYADHDPLVVVTLAAVAWKVATKSCRIQDEEQYQQYNDFFFQSYPSFDWIDRDVVTTKLSKRWENSFLVEKYLKMWGKVNVETKAWTKTWKVVFSENTSLSKILWNW